MRLRTVGLILALGLLAVPLPAGAQKPGKVYRVGYLATGSSSPRGSPLRAAFRQGLRELGYVEGENLVIEWRGAEGRYDRLPGLAAELVQSNVDVIVSTSDTTHFPAKQATARIPIVMLISHDPVGDGLVESLARPGGNITGLSSVLIDLEAKRIELLRDTVPGLSRVGLLYLPGDTPVAARALKRVENAAAWLGLVLRKFQVREVDELETVFAAIAKERPDALGIGYSPFTFRHRRRIMELSARLGIPTMSGSREFVQIGGLMSYGVSMRGIWRRGAYFVDKILKGANPADLPVEQPMRFELIVNMKTARALGLTIPESTLIFADEVIE